MTLNPKLHPYTAIRNGQVLGHFTNAATAIQKIQHFGHGSAPPKPKSTTASPAKPSSQASSSPSSAKPKPNAKGKPVPTLYKKITDRERLDFLLKHQAIPKEAPGDLWQLNIKGRDFISTTPRLTIDLAFKALQGRKAYRYPTSDTAS